jgi:hypothetical protein
MLVESDKLIICYPTPQAQLTLLGLCSVVGPSDVPGPACAQSPCLGWALAGSGLQKPKPDPELRAGPGLGLVGLKPGPMSQRSNWQKYYTKIQFSTKEQLNQLHVAFTVSHVSLLQVCTSKHWPPRLVLPWLSFKLLAM